LTQTEQTGRNLQMTLGKPEQRVSDARQMACKFRNRTCPPL
jgi:hypothetical protein